MMSMPKTEVVIVGSQYTVVVKELDRLKNLAIA